MSVTSPCMASNIPGMWSGSNYPLDESRFGPDRLHCSAGCPHLSTCETLQVAYAKQHVEHQPCCALVPCHRCNNAILAPVVGHTAKGKAVANEPRGGSLIIVATHAVNIHRCRGSRGGRGEERGGGANGGCSLRQRGCHQQHG